MSPPLWSLTTAASTTNSSESNGLAFRGVAATRRSNHSSTDPRSRGSISAAMRVKLGDPSLTADLMAALQARVDVVVTQTADDELEVSLLGSRVTAADEDGLGSVPGAAAPASSEPSKTAAGGHDEMGRARLPPSRASRFLEPVGQRAAYGTETCPARSSAFNPSSWFSWSCRIAFAPRPLGWFAALRACGDSRLPPGTPADRRPRQLHVAAF